MSDVPQSILDTAHDLSPGAMVDLYKLVTRNAVSFHFTAHPQVTWQGNLYDEIPCSLSQTGRSSDGQVHRPRLTVANPGGIFTASVSDGNLEGALVYRYRLLKSDLDLDNDFAIEERYKVFKIVSIITNGPIVMETRDVLDGYRMKLPRREFIPPEFSHVRLR